MKERIEKDLKESLRKGEEERVSALRLILSAIKNAEKAKGRALSEEEIIDILSREAKQRRESIEEFEKGGRGDLAEKERRELGIIMEYLPPQLSREEIEEMARKVIEEVGARGPSDKGKVMGKLMPMVRGRAEGRVVSEIVSEILSRL